jgi:drug/metabolite transporter (DMT)-like permease
MHALLGRLQMLAAAVLFSTGGAGIKASSLSAWQVAGVRSAFAAASLLLFSPAARTRWTPATVALGMSYAVTMIQFVLATKLTTAANAIFLQAAAPVYVMALSPWILRERLGRTDLLFAAPIALGVALFFANRYTPTAMATSPGLGNLLAAGSGMTWALTLIGLRWVARRGSAERPLMAAVVSGNAIAFALCLPAGFPVTTIPAADWGILAYLGAFQIGLAYVFLTRAIQRLAAFEASLLLLIENPLNPLWVWLLHGEAPGAWALAGGALIVGATGLRAWLEAPREPTTAAEVASLPGD